MLLEKAFGDKPFPTTDEKEVIAAALHMDLKHVHSW